MRHTCFYKYIAILPIFMTFALKAQNDGTAAYTDLDSMYAVQRAVKFDPVQVFFGDYQFFYEHMTAERWSVEVGLGPTRRNFTASMFQYELDDFGSNVDIKTRYAASLALRRYFWDTGELYGPYLSVLLQHRRHDKTYNVIGLDGKLSGIAFDDSRRYTTLLLAGGYQAIPMQSNIFCDFYLGLGLRYRDLDVVRSNAVNDPSRYSVSSEQSWVGAVHFGVKVGWGF